MANMHLEESLQNPQPSTPEPSIPLQLAGFLTGNTIHVQGDAGNLHLSGKFDIHQCQSPNNHVYIPGTDKPENPTPYIRPFSISSLFSSMTPNNNIEEKDQITNTNPLNHEEKTLDFTEFCDTERPEFTLSPDVQVPVTGKCDVASTVTRLRSGVISRVSYFPSVKHNFVGESSGCARGSSFSMRKSKVRGGREREDALERLLRRRSFPVRPCSSYSFFVMAKWGSAKSPSFVETSKRLGHMWCKLPHEEKKVFVDMALKDNARYKKQCILLRRK